jgi:hypothetical protein
LTPTAITAGLYQFATVTFDAFGRATNAVNNTVVLGITSSTLTLTGTATNPIINLTPTAITPATYQFATVTFDTYGRATNAVNNTVVLGITSSTLTLTGTATNPIINLTPTAITPATYQFATVTFDTYGRATNAVNNTVVLGITSSTLTLTGTATNPIINLTPTAITPNTYQLPTVTFDTYGRATSAVQNTLTGTTNQIDVTSFPNPVISLNATFLTTVNGKVSKAGDTMTGQLNSTFAGSQSVPNFSINSNSGIFQSATNHLNFATNGVNRLDIDNLGIVTITTLPTGVVKSASGLLSAGLVQNAEIATQTPFSQPNSIVSRDGSNNFEANMISLSGTTTFPHDVATKDYVDIKAGAGLSVKQPVVAVCVDSHITDPPTGSPATIDSVSVTTGDRVLLIAQTNPFNNGAWVVAAGAWTRPTDFANGTLAGAAYFLVQMGTIYTGSSWVCSTPTVTIGGGNLSFSQFSTPQSASGFNDSIVSATVYKNSFGSTLHFRSLLNDPNNYLTMTEQTDDVKFVVNATPLGNSNTIVARDGSGNFLSNMITLSTGLIVSAGSFASPSIQVGPVSTGLSSASGNLQLSTAFGLGLSISSITGFVTLPALTTIGIVHNDATGLLSTSLIVNADIDSAAAIVDTKLATISSSGKVLNSATTATSALGINTIVSRDASNNFSAGTITANLTGNATSANSFSGSLLGDVTGTQSATIVSLVGSVTAANVASGANLANGATSALGINTIVKRDGSNNFSAGTITANLTGNATTATTATSFSGSLLGDVTGTQSATVVSFVGGVTAANVASGSILANGATSANTGSTIVKRDGSGNFSAGTITASLTGNATTATSSTNFSGSLLGDVTGTQSATVVGFVGGVTAANISLGVNLANGATSVNTGSTIVKRDGSGNFSAGTITATLSGNATSATSSTSFSGSLLGDVTGTQSATVVSFVGGATSANVASGVILANAATNANTGSTIVKRDGTGNFSAGIITATRLVSSTPFLCKSSAVGQNLAFGFSAGVNTLVNITGFTKELDPASVWTLTTTTGKHTYNGTTMYFKVDILFTMAASALNQGATIWVAKNAGTPPPAPTAIDTTFWSNGNISAGALQQLKASTIVQMTTGDTVQLAIAYLTTASPTFNDCLYLITPIN